MKKYIKAAILDIRDEDPEFQLECAGDMNIPIDELLKLGQQWEYYEVRWKAIDTIKRLANSSNRKRIFEGNPKLRDTLALTCSDSDLLSIFAEDPEDDVRWTVAGESTTPPEALDKLSYDHYVYVRHDVAKNENTPDYTLARLSKDEERFVREGVAENPKTPYAILLQLANDESRYVREAVMKNKNFGSSV